MDEEIAGLHMSEFQVYFNYGLAHILDYANGYDHILFIIALCSVYLLRDWKKVIILVTAFTVGHSVTLALATLSIIKVNSALVEFLVPLTIFIAAFSNVLKREEIYTERNVHLNYAFALFFGLIHGMAFANALGMDSKNIFTRLLAFNLGLELGQIIIVILFLIASFIFVDIFNTSRRDWKIVLSSMIAGMALLLMKDRVFW